MHIVMTRALRTVRRARDAAGARCHQEKFEVPASLMAHAIMVAGARPEQNRHVFTDTGKRKKIGEALITRGNCGGSDCNQQGVGDG